MLEDAKFVASAFSRATLWDGRMTDFSLPERGVCFVTRSCIATERGEAEGGLLGGHRQLHEKVQLS